MNKTIAAKALIKIAKRLIAKEYPKGKYYKQIAFNCAEVFRGDAPQTTYYFDTLGKFSDRLMFHLNKKGGNKFLFIVFNDSFGRQKFEEQELISADSSQELIFKCEEALEKRIIKKFDEHCKKLTSKRAS